MSLLAASGMSATSHADGGIYDLGVTVGTIGLGIEGGMVIVPNEFAARISTGFMSLNTNTVSNGIDYNGNVDLKNFALLGDYHPFMGSFRLTGGLVLNDDSLSLSATPTAGQTYTLNGQTYTASPGDHANASIGFNKVAPYVGIGFGSAAADAGLHFTSDFGLMYMGAPSASLSITTANPSAQSAANQYAVSAQNQLNADLSSYKWYPVAKVGIVYRFK